MIAGESVGSDRTCVEKVVWCQAHCKSQGIIATVTILINFVIVIASWVLLLLKLFLLSILKLNANNQAYRRTFNEE